MTPLTRWRQFDFAITHFPLTPARVYSGLVFNGLTLTVPSIGIAQYYCNTVSWLRDKGVNWHLHSHHAILLHPLPSSSIAPRFHRKLTRSSSWMRVYLCVAIPLKTTRFLGVWWDVLCGNCPDEWIGDMNELCLPRFPPTLNPFRTKTPKYLFPRGNEPLLYHQIGHRFFFLFSHYKSVKLGFG